MKARFIVGYRACQFSGKGGEIHFRGVIEHHIINTHKILELFKRRNGEVVYLEFWIFSILKYSEQNTNTLRETWLVLVTAIPSS
jgi:hypothetical protein